MSMQSMKQFMARLEQDSELRRGLDARLAEVGEDELTEQVIAYAADNGYAMDREQLSPLLALSADEGLSDEALQGVAGGFDSNQGLDPAVGRAMARKWLDMRRAAHERWLQRLKREQGVED